MPVVTLTQDNCDRFVLTPMGHFLSTDTPGSLRAISVMIGQERHHSAWASLAHRVRTGKAAFPKVHETSILEWLSRNPVEGAIFNEATTSLTGVADDAVLQAYDFSGLERIVDIGGGGYLLSRILQANPDVRDILFFDLPHVIDGARALLAGAGVSARCEMHGGDFLATVPAGCDVYVLRHILRNSDDATCVTILRHCCERMAPTGQILIIETVVPPSGVPSFAHLPDLEMLVVEPGGRDRTEREFAELFAKVGPGIPRIHPNALSVFSARSSWCLN